MSQKYLVTVASLIALSKSEQTRIHMNGLYNVGGTTTEIEAIIKAVVIHGGVVKKLFCPNVRGIT